MEDKNLDQKLSDNHPEETKVLDTNTQVADKPKSKKKKKQSFIHYLIPTVLFISMIVFGGLFLRDFLEYRAAEDEYASLQDHIVISEEPKKEAPNK